MTLEKKEEAIYVALSFLTAVGQLTWVQLTYNDPSFAEAWTSKQWLIVASISSVFVLSQTLIAWKAFLHKTPGQDVPMPPPITQKPADTKPTP